MKRYFKFFASILLVLYFTSICCAQTKIDWKQIKNIPDTLDFKNVLLEHLLFKAAYQPVLDPAYQGAIYYDNRLNRLRVFENGEWRDMSVTIASDSIGAPLTILGYLQASDIYASRSAHIGTNVYVGGGVNASGTSVFNYLKVNNAMKLPTVASKTLGVGSIYYNPTTNKLMVLDSSNNWKETSVDVDSAMSATSTNPVQNKVIYSKVDQIDADLINGLAYNLQQSYAYANGIATQAYNYAASAAIDAETASKNYADTQLGIMRDYVSQQLGSGTSDLYVKSIRTTNASVTNQLDAGKIKADDALLAPLFTDQKVIQYVDVNDKDHAALWYDRTNQQLKYTYAVPNYNIRQTWAISDFRNTVSTVAMGTASGTIAITKNGSTTDVPVKGLGDAAYANVASFTPQSSSTPPSNPYNGQLYFDTGSNKLKYWNGTVWTDVGGGADISYGTDSTKQTCFSVGDMQIITGVATTSQDIYTPTVVNFVHDFTATPTIAISQNAVLWCPITNITTHSFSVTFGSYGDAHNFNSPVNWIAIGKR